MSKVSQHQFVELSPLTHTALQSPFAMKIFILTVFVALAAAQNAYNQEPAYKSSEYPVQPYSFEWEVNDAPSYNNYGHSEKSDGNVVTGSYRVLLPDGRTQIVNYRADKNGYVADVKYIGEAKYPEYKPAPAYKAPAPSYPAPPAYQTPAAPPAYKAPAAPVYKPAPAAVKVPAAPVYKTPAPPAYKAPAPAPPAYKAPPAPVYKATAPAPPAYKAPAPVAVPAYKVPATPVYRTPAVSSSSWTPIRGN